MRQGQRNGQSGGCRHQVCLEHSQFLCFAHLAKKELYFPEFHFPYVPRLGLAQEKCGQATEGRGGAVSLLSDAPKGTGTTQLCVSNTCGVGPSPDLIRSLPLHVWLCVEGRAWLPPQVNSVDGDRCGSYVCLLSFP